MLLLHGAGGSGRRVIRTLLPLADTTGTIILAPDSRGTTWDFIGGPFGPDVAFIDTGLSATFGRYDIDLAHLTIAGFSDGASYALSLGLANGDIFRHIVAFSPGMATALARTGRPRIFISHGTEDPILPIGRTSRVIVPQLRDAGYDVTYREFPGTHTVPFELARDAFQWSARP
jgi:phospholipase/carboxylesterase